MLKNNNYTRRRFLEHTGIGVAAWSLYMLSPSLGGQISLNGGLESLSRANGWLNSPALTARQLRGRVVLVQFWTFTCINWIRTAPYIRAWEDKYRKAGLAVIGVHTPEFAFERDAENVRRAAQDLNVRYPVAIDNEYAIWKAFDNHYWPALYLVDGEGRVRHHQFGEGAYGDIEEMIQKLLVEAGTHQVDDNPTLVEGRGIEAEADWSNLKTPETYVGYHRAENLASPGGAAADRSHVYTFPRNLRLNEWALAGSWNVRGGAITLDQAAGRIAFRFHARDVHLVMGPRKGARPTRFRVSLDGEPPRAAHGGDVDDEGNGMANEQRMYQLIRQPQPIVDRVFQIEFLDPGVEAFSFTFG